VQEQNSVSSSSSTRQMIGGGIQWWSRSLWVKSRAWIRNPMNMALSVWILAVGVSGAILFMVMTGMLNRVLPSKPRRDTWFEVNNQILNALFTLMCLYQHPRRFYHLALVCRWKAGDMHQLRQAYCKDGACKPNERKHMTAVILLLHLNCFAQYALCGLNLGYRRPRRPVVGVALTVAVAICAPAVAGMYNNLSPLGRDYEAPAPAEGMIISEEESQLQRKTPDTERRYSLVPRQGQGEEPQWVGGLWEDLWDDMSLAYLSLFCSCCVFGWNASRLGLGNMYVHVATFVLLCLAPFFILDLAAINVDDEAVRDALGLAGIFLCVFGLLYGGFWRIQMRRRFGLPENRACCGKPDLTDCLLWLCCYPCSLAQEVRTADAYEVVVLLDTPMHRHPTLQEELATMQEPPDEEEGGGVIPPSTVSATRS
jgi:Cys-rich protein (TIGR01571 family)